MVAGVDGTRRGWVAVICDGNLGKAAALFVRHIVELPRSLRVVAVDIPIGLPRRGSRAADVLARRRLGQPRGRSVFPCPIRSSIGAADWHEACRRTERVDGRRVTMQTFGIFPKIKEVDDLLRTQAWAQEVVREVHPEVSFAEWSGSPLRSGKKSPSGREERQRLIAATFGKNVFSRARETLRGHGVGADDLADAFAAAWTASRILLGTAKAFPAEPITDDAGLPMQIWA